MSQAIFNPSSTRSNDLKKESSNSRKQTQTREKSLAKKAFSFLFLSDYED